MWKITRTPNNVEVKVNLDGCYAWWVEKVEFANKPSDRDILDWPQHPNISPEYFVEKHLTQPMLYINYWGFDIEGKHKYRNDDPGPKFEHHFHMLTEDQLFEIIIAGSDTFDVTKLFSVVNA